MAEGLLRHYYGSQYEAFSAGASPCRVNPFAIKVMAEIGIDISNQTSKSIEEFRDKEIDWVITVCSSSPNVVCPFCSTPLVSTPEIVSETLSKAKRYIQHGFSDPSEVDGSDMEKTLAFRRVRDEIKKWVLDYFANSETKA